MSSLQHAIGKLEGEKIRAERCPDSLVCIADVQNILQERPLKTGRRQKM